MTEKKIQELMKHVENITEQMGKPIRREDYIIQDLGCPHVPGKLPNGYCGVYFFEYQGEMLKIGKANHKSKGRFENHHYGFGAPSTLAKSICADEEFAALGIQRENVGAWMKKNLHRYNVLVKKEDGKAATEIIEAVMHYGFRPRYEGAIR